MLLNRKCHLTWKLNNTITELFQRDSRGSNDKISEKGHVQHATKSIYLKTKWLKILPV